MFIAEVGDLDIFSDEKVYSLAYVPSVVEHL